MALTRRRSSVPLIIIRVKVRTCVSGVPLLVTIRTKAPRELILLGLSFPCQVDKSGRVGGCGTICKVQFPGSQNGHRVLLSPEDSVEIVVIYTA